MLVTEKAGLVRLAVDGLVRPTPVIDLRGVVSDTADSGILAVALDPDFAATGWFYLAYVADDGGDTLWHTDRVVRYTLVGEVADPASAHVVLGTVPLDTCLADQTTPGCLVTHGAHTVDDLLFAADGSLLVSVGDGAPGQPARAVLAQRVDVLVGKVLRVDPDTGLGLADNPYFVAGQPDANRSRVWAYGFRNPFRMSFAPDGDLYVGDVGEVGWEEVDRIVAGGNYGWPCFEGVAGPGTAPAGDPDCDAVRTGAVVHRTPLLAYPHVDFSGSITLGAFADGDAYPAPYQGRLFLGDYTQSKVWTLDVDPPAPDEPRLEDFGSPPGLGAGVKYLAGPDGDIWYADIASGSIRRIVYEPEPTTCPSGQFLMETFRNRELEPEPDGRPWVMSCVGKPPAGPNLVAPGEPNQGEGWSIRWSGSPQLAPGTYVLDQASSGTLTVHVNGVLVHDGETFTVPGTDVNEATAEIEVVLVNNPAFDDVPVFVNFDWGYRLSWERVGTAPVVSLHGLAQGMRVPALQHDRLVRLGRGRGGRATAGRPAARHRHPSPLRHRQPARPPVRLLRGHRRVLHRRRRPCPRQDRVPGRGRRDGLERMGGGVRPRLRLPGRRRGRTLLLTRQRPRRANFLRANFLRADAGVRGPGATRTVRTAVTATAREVRARVRRRVVRASCPRSEE